MIQFRETLRWADGIPIRDFGLPGPLRSPVRFPPWSSELLSTSDVYDRWHSQFESIGAKSLTAIRNYVKEVGEGEFPGDELVHLLHLPPS